MSVGAGGPHSSELYLEIPNNSKRGSAVSDTHEGTVERATAQVPASGKFVELIPWTSNGRSPVVDRCLGLLAVI